jgi:hypothetical protein
MRTVIALLFAVLATAVTLTLPLWAPVSDILGGAPADDLALMSRMIADLRAHNYGDARSLIANAMRTVDDSKLDRVGAAIPVAGPPRIIVMAWTKPATGAALRQANLDVFYDYGAAGALHAKAAIIEARGIKQIGAMTIEPIAGNVLHKNDFHWPASWRSKRWIVFFAAVFADLIAFATFVLCLTDRLIRWRWRWLWALLVLIGIARFNLEWTAIHATIMPVALLVPPAQFVRFPIFGPWVLSVSIPLGAIIYWSQRHIWARATAAGA